MTDQSQPPLPPRPPAPPAAQGYYGRPTPSPLASDPSTPLDKPYYGISFLPAVKRFWQKYAVFTGRASQSEYWWALLGIVVVGAILYLVAFLPAVLSGALAGDAGQPPVAALIVTGLFGLALGVFLLASIVPVFAIYWRRLQDANLPGALALLVLIPSLGGIWGLVIGFLPANPLGARFDRR